MFTLKDKGNAIPIARITGGKYNKKIIYLNQDENLHFNGGKEESTDDSECSDCHKSFSRPDALRRHLKSNACKIAFAKSYAGKLSQEKAKVFNELEINDGKIEIIPDNSMGRVVYYLAGPSGSGKSYLAGQIIKQLQNEKDCNVYLFSPIEGDEAFADIPNVCQITVDEEFVKEPLEPTEMNNSIVVFDDIDSFDKKYAKVVKELQSKCLKIGRHNNLDVFSTNHLLTDYHKTRDLLNEAKDIVIYPKFSTQMSVNHILKEYAGLGKKQIDNVCDLDSRWVCIHKHVPQYIVSERKISTLKDI